ncbi:MAG: polysaccharide deacetylase family protein [Candidatus Heimdallarchaeota archaeon]|nr:polysaccharide deacetylase family protein [Candidatus Heimdallarchaeota archaeon]
MYSTIILHANLQYAEIPVDEIPKVVEQSYIPVLTLLLDIPDVEVVLNFTGVTLEILHNEYPEVISLLKEGIKKGKFELTGCGYSHPIFPLLPIEDINKQIEYNLEVLEKILNYTPKGFWLPELAYDPTLPNILKTHGFSYIFVDDELYRMSSPLLNDANLYNTEYYSASHYIIDFLKAKGLLRKISRFRKAIRGMKKMLKRAEFDPVEIMGSKGTITGLRVHQGWSAFTSASLMGYPFLSIKKVIKTFAKYRKQSGLVIPYGTDIEFFGYRSLVDRKLIAPESLRKLLERMTYISDHKMILPMKYLEKNKPTEIGYLKTGSWAPDRRLDLWTKDEDNQKLERLCEEVRNYMKQLPPDEIDEEMWKHLLMAENSDGRGWDPIPERRLHCFNHALEALKLVKSKYLEMMYPKKK